MIPWVASPNLYHERHEEHEELNMQILSRWRLNETIGVNVTLWGAGTSETQALRPAALMDFLARRILKGLGPTCIAR
jgi:hypothetical protein